MDKPTATQLMQEILNMTSQLNVIMGMVEASMSGDELRTVRGRLANVTAAAGENSLLPIVRHYPELEPHW